MRYFTGIDPGKKGAIVTINENREIILKEKVPLKNNKVIYRSLWGVFEKIPPSIIGIEDVHSIYRVSAKSNFEFGLIKGVLLGMSVSKGYNIEMIRPKVWQNNIWIEEDVVYKEDDKKKDTKATSLNVAKRLYPDVNLLATKRSKVPHDGIVDALLIAEYLLRLNE